MYVLIVIATLLNGGGIEGNNTLLAFPNKEACEAEAKTFVKTWAKNQFPNRGDFDKVYHLCAEVYLGDPV